MSLRLAAIIFVGLFITISACAGTTPAPNTGVDLCPESPSVEVSTMKQRPSAPEVYVPPVVRASRFQQGDAVEIEFHDSWYSAHVLSVVGAERYEVSYDNYDGDYNLIVGSDRIRERNQAQSAPPDAGRVVTSVEELRRDMQVSVLYGQTWYPSTILAFTPEGVRIRYIGYDESWDQTVPLERIRIPR